MRLARALIPEWAKRKYAEIAARRASNNRRRERDRATVITKSRLLSMLEELGLQTGDAVMVHSAVGQFNNVESGADGILEAIVARIGDGGTLLVPTFPHWLTAIRANAAFDARETPSAMGVLTERVRRMPQAHRSLHPTHPIGAIGPLAAELTAGHHELPFAFGEGTPFFRHAQRNGKILLVGVDLNSLSSFHIYEDMIVPTGWLPVYETAPRTFGMVDRGGNSFEYTGYFHSLESASLRDVERLRPVFEEQAGMKTIRTDYSKISILDSRAMVLCCLRELLSGRSAYGPVALSSDDAVRVQQAMKVMAA